MKVNGFNSITSWIALTACALISFFIALPMRLAGLFFVIVLDRFDTNRKLASTPVMVFGFLRAFTGPFIGYLGDAFGYRTVIMAGAIFSAVGIGGCYFAEDITTVIICLGVIYGLGLAFGNTLMPAVLKLHFNKNVNLVNGVYLTGSCLGAVVMSPVIQYLNQEYGVSGMFLIVSGLFLNCIPAALLLKHPHNEKILSIKTNEDKSDRNNKDTIPQQKSDDNYHVNLAYVSDDGALGYESVKETGMVSDVYHGNCKTKITEKKFKDSEKCLNNESINIKNEIIEKFHRDSFDENKNAEKFHNIIRNEGKQKEFSSSSDIRLTRFSETRSSVNKLKDLNNSLLLNNKMNDKNQNYAVATHENENSPKIKANRNKLSCYSFTLFADPTFHVITIVQSFHAFVTTLNWTVLIDFSRDKGIPDEESVYFVMFLPVAEMFGNLCLNWITDRNYMTRTNFSLTCFLILIVDGVFILYVQTFALMMITVLIFGSVSGAVGTTFPGIIIEFIPEDKQNMALASRFVLYAFLCITKSPLIGYFRGTRGSYDWIYYIILICLSISAILCKLTPVVASCLEKRKKAKECG